MKSVFALVLSVCLLAVGVSAQGTDAWIDVTSSPYTAKADFITISSGTCTSGSMNITTGSSAFFTSTSPGKSIILPGCGTSGQVLTTTINTFISATAATITTAASTSVSGGSAFQMGTDNTGPINSAIAACGALPNNGAGYQGVVFFPAGTYLHISQLTLNASCLLMGWNREATLVKGYSAGGSLPGPAGSLVISGSNTGIMGLAYNGNSANFSGNCIVDATNNMDVLLQNNDLYNCYGHPLIFSANGTGATGVTRAQIFNNKIVCSSKLATWAILLQETLSNVDIAGNYLDCSLSQNNTTPGSATIQAQSAGQTTSFTKVKIRENEIISPGCSTGQCWGIQMQNADSYALTGIELGINHISLSGPSAGCGSFQGVGASHFNLGICDSNDTALTYTMWEIIGSTGLSVDGGTINGESAGTSNSLVISGTSFSSFKNLTVNGFGENGTGGTTAGILVNTPAGGGSQPITSCTETGTGNPNLAKYTVTTPPLQATWQPPTTVYLTGFTPAAYNGRYKIENTNYSRTAGTFSVILPVTGLGPCTILGSVNSTSSGNTIDATINMPTGKDGGMTTSTLFGVLERCTQAGCDTSNNKFNLTVNGTLTPGATVTEDGISMQGTGTSDSNTFTDPILNNLTVGINLAAGTNNSFLKPRFINVATHVSGTTGAYIDYLASSTPPSISGCGTVTGQLGNGFTGSFNSQTSSTCAAVITPGETALNGWRCTANDITTPTDTLVQTAKSTTTCTVSGTTTTGDLIQFTATPY